MATETPTKPGEGSTALKWSLLAIALLALYMFCGPTEDPSFLQGFRGNLVGEIVGGFVFFFFAGWLDRKVGQLRAETHRLTQETHKLSEQSVKILRAQEEIQAKTHQLSEQSVAILKAQEAIQAKTHELTTQSVKILEGQEDDREEDRRIRHFMQFVYYENYHDVRFPDIITESFGLGLAYTIVPVRDTDGKPVVKKNELDELWLVRIDEPAQRRVLNAQQLREYDDAPIHTGEHYFCKYFNGAWHMGRDSAQSDWFKFYLSGKVGQCEVVVTADEFMKKSGPPDGVVWKEEVLVDEHGKPTDGFGGAWMVTVYKDRHDAIWVQRSGAPPKRFVREIHMLKNTSRLVVDNFEGYYVGADRQPFLDLMASTVEKAGHRIPESRTYD